MWSLEHSKFLARELVRGMGPRWFHLVDVGQAAERLAATSDLLTEDLASPAWLHDIGHFPKIHAPTCTPSTAR